VKQAPQV